MECLESHGKLECLGLGLDLWDLVAKDEGNEGVLDK